MKRNATWIIGSWLTGHIVLIAGHVLLVFLYSVTVAPGLTNAEYSQFALDSGPWFSIVSGGPVFYIIARVLRKRLAPNGRRAGLLVWALYSATDAAIVLASSAPLGPWFTLKWVASQSVKLAGVLLANRKSGPGTNAPLPRPAD